MGCRTACRVDTYHTTVSPRPKSSVRLNASTDGEFCSDVCHLLYSTSRSGSAKRLDFGNDSSLIDIDYRCGAKARVWHFPVRNVHVFCHMANISTISYIIIIIITTCYGAIQSVLISALSGSYMWNKTEIKQNLFQVCFRRDCFISVLFQRLLHVKQNAETNQK